MVLNGLKYCRPWGCLLLVLLMLTSCASVPSGRYITLSSNVNVQKVAETYKVSPQVLRAHNPQKRFSKGDKIFIPSAAGMTAKNRRPASAVIDLLGKEAYIWPVRGSKRISSPYGMRKRPRVRRVRMHHGIDIAASRGSEIVAVADGVVTVAGHPKGERALSGYGKTVIIRHEDSVYTLYAHASKIVVHHGQVVKQGDTIALVGSTGRSSGAHLHFEFRRDGQSIDPQMVYEEQDGVRSFDLPVLDEQLADEDDHEISPDTFTTAKRIVR